MYVSGVSGGFQDAVHITAILGESVVFNCQVEFPADHPVPYVLQWEKKVGDTVGYPTHNTLRLSLALCPRLVASSVLPPPLPLSP